jgi:hypothetical protein
VNRSYFEFHSKSIKLINKLILLFMQRINIAYNVSKPDSGPLRFCRKCHSPLKNGHNSQCLGECPSRTNKDIECPLLQLNPSRYLDPHFHGNDNVNFAQTQLNNILSKRKIELQESEHKKKPVIKNQKIDSELLANTLDTEAIDDILEKIRKRESDKNTTPFPKPQTKHFQSSLHHDQGYNMPIPQPHPQAMNFPYLNQNYQMYQYQQQQAMQYPTMPPYGYNPPHFYAPQANGGYYHPHMNLPPSISMPQVDVGLEVLNEKDEQNLQVLVSNKESPSLGIKKNTNQEVSISKAQDQTQDVTGAQANEDEILRISTLENKFESMSQDIGKGFLQVFGLLEAMSKKISTKNNE